VPDARAIAGELEKRGVKLALGGSVHDPTDPMGRMFFDILATFAGFEADLIRMRARKGMAVARAKGKLKGRKPKLSDRRQTELRRMYDTEEYSISGFAEVFDMSRPTVSRVLARTKAAGAGAAGQAWDMPRSGSRTVPGTFRMGLGPAMSRRERAETTLRERRSPSGTFHAAVPQGRTWPQLRGTHSRLLPGKTVRCYRTVTFGA
jgi:hypothetical protein